MCLPSQIFPLNCLLVHDNNYLLYGCIRHNAQGRDSQAVSALALFLKGPAELLYLENLFRFGRDFRHMQAMFIQKFVVDANRALAEEQLLARKQSREKSIDSYAYDVRARYHQLGKTPWDAVTLFIQVFSPQIKGQVAVMQPATIEDAERIARIWFYWMFYDHFSARSLLAKQRIARTALTYSNIAAPVATVAEITPEALGLVTGTLIYSRGSAVLPATGPATWSAAWHTMWTAATSQGLSTTPQEQGNPRRRYGGRGRVRTRIIVISVVTCVTLGKG